MVLRSAACPTMAMIRARELGALPGEGQSGPGGEEAHFIKSRACNEWRLGISDRGEQRGTSGKKKTKQLQVFVIKHVCIHINSLIHPLSYTTHSHTYTRSTIKLSKLLNWWSVTQ